MDVLPVVLDTTDRLKLGLVWLSQLKLVESLAEHAILRYLERLARVVKTWLGNRVKRVWGRLCSVIEELIRAITTGIATASVVTFTSIVRIALSGKTVSLLRRGQFRIQPNANRGGLSARYNFTSTINAVQLCVQVLPMHLGCISG